MELKEYIKQSERTMIDQGFSMNMLHASLGIVTETAELLDAYKKHIFYGKELDLVNIKEEIGDIFWYLAIPIRSLSEHQKEVLLTQFEFEFDNEPYSNSKHLINILLDMTKQVFELHSNLNYSYNINEHSDYLVNNYFLLFPYIATICNKLKLDIKEILQINIDKLAKRYPEKFDSNLALNRDLKGEREVLEGLNTKTEQVDYISELHDKGLYVDNSGIDSRVPKVVVDGSN